MREIKSKIKTTILLTVALLVIIEAVSLPIIGWDPVFVAGVLIGGAVSVACYMIMLAAGERMIETKRKGLFFLGFIARVVLYAAALYVTVVKMSLASGLGCAAALLTSYISVIILDGVVMMIKEKRRKARGEAEPAPEYVDGEFDADGNRRFVFVKDYSTVKYVGGRTYVTHKRFKRLKPSGEAKQ